MRGLGAGGEGFDAGVLGPAPTRGVRTRRFEEFVALLDELLTHPVTEHAGEFYQAHGARMHPGTLARPRTPFVVAANGPRAMALAARYGQGWATYGPVFDPGAVGEAGPTAAQDAWWAGLTDLVGQFRAVRAAQVAAGHLAADAPEPRLYLNLDGAPVYSLDSVDTLVEGVERATSTGFTDVVVHWPRAEGIYAGKESVLDEVADRLPGLSGRGGPPTRS